ncbi:hypothetical protein JRQ81_011591 [Phrynocephalus forsythii]|uniref:Ig-like domain-containing protein n=1 Tax=Phrynocephalus forsythii TaxID=171643 RepID=A0A9Q0X6G8_9SAUR|nr:hypothetical protein JRQ81_011591 [Phrynocephalus forsythii]
MGLAWKKTSLWAMLMVLILAFLCRGVLSQARSSYTVTVPSSSYVQRGRSLYMPCQFTYRESDASSREGKISVYWFKISEGGWFCFYKTFTWNQCFPGLLMATNDNQQTLESSAQNRFYVVGDPNQGNCSFLIVDAHPEDEGSYYLRIEGNSKLKFSYSSSEHTSPHIMLIEQPRNIRIMKTEGYQQLDLSSQNLMQVMAREGDSVSLFCRADGKPTPDMTWVKLNHTGTISMDGSLHFPWIKVEDAGEYQCQAENQLGAIKANLRVIVQYAPRTVAFDISRASRRNPELIHDYPREVANGSQLMAQEGDSLWVLCKAEGYPAVSANWTKPGRKNFPNRTLELIEVTVEDEGWYTCRATNGQGSAQGSFNLRVAYGPRLSRNPQRNSTCWLQDTGLLCHCSFQSQPHPTIRWEVDGEALTENSNGKNHSITSLADGNQVTSALNWSSSLHTNHTISCFGRNAFGVYTMQFLLKASPATPSSTGTQKAAVVSGLCGVLLTASLFLTGLLLFTFYKRRETPSKAGNVEVAEFISREPQKKTSMSLIYSNILPLAQITPHVGHFKAAEKTPQRGQAPSIPAPATEETEDLHYAALDFKLKKRGTPILEEDLVDYSEIKPK